MKRPAFAWLLAGLTAGWIGCQSATEPADETAPADPTTESAPTESAEDAALEETQADPAAPADADVVLVSLSVPNMF